ncbi:hypothetical protein B9Z55_026864 [Caenorhabditis nigoni]|uniref:RBR-type E3 ubiquitin transferase n=1 Tax=Caenorhabditis nigoni TaxID=1611254 RepID=A0A2G5SHM3_9PELO|nr:hypothetical protein B9Z55_026864 [Caenorhabditis nigoni]
MRKFQFQPILAPNFQILSMADLHQEMNSKIDHIQSKFSIPRGQCRIMLHENWDFGDFPSQIPKNSNFNQSTVTEPIKGECEICCQEEAELMGYCCHVACENCWSSYISDKVDKQKTSMIQCLKCQQWIPDDIIEKVLEGNEQFLEQFEMLKMKHYVESQKNNLISCEKCPNFIRFFLPNGAKKMDITCECGLKMCSKCQKEPHDPVSCENYAKWWRILLEMIENPTTRWMMNNTKDCPNCFSRIEKWGGCDVIKCWKCQVQFCWNCFVGVNHMTQHVCDKSPESQNRRGGDLRLEFYYKGFLKHFGKSLTTKNETLQKSQKTLELAYIFAYFQPGTSQEFLKLLNVLESKTEKFQEFLDSEGPKPQEILEKKAQILEIQTKKLLDYCNNPASVWEDTVPAMVKAPRIPIEQIVIPTLIWMCVLAGFTLDPVFFNFGSIFPAFLYITPTIADKLPPIIGNLFYNLSYYVILVLLLIISLLVTVFRNLGGFFTNASRFLAAAHGTIDLFVHPPPHV